MTESETRSNEPAAADSSKSPEGWATALQSIWSDLPGLVRDRVDLLSLELRRAGRALAWIAAMLVSAAILGVTAWLALWAGIAVGLVELGLHWSLSLLIVLGLNVAAAAIAIAYLRRQLPLLGLPATRRHLTWGRAGCPTATPPAPPPIAQEPAGRTPITQGG